MIKEKEHVGSRGSTRLRSGSADNHDKDVDMGDIGDRRCFTFRAVLAAVILFAVMYSPLCLADSTPTGGGDQGQPAPVDIASEGRALPRKGEDPAKARQRAIADAERNAFLAVLKPLVQEKIFAEEQNSLGKILMIKRGAILAGPGLVVEEREEAGACVVDMTLPVLANRLHEVVMSVFASRRAVLLSAQGEGLGSALRSRARAGGFRLMDFGEFSDEKAKTLLAAIRSGDKESGKALALYLLAGSVIEGRVNSSFSEVTGEVFSARAGGSVRVTRLGGPSATFSVGGIKGFGSNEKKARLDAAGKASAALASQAVKSLSGRQKRK